MLYNGVPIESSLWIQIWNVNSGFPDFYQDVLDLFMYQYIIEIYIPFAVQNMVILPIYKCVSICLKL